MKECRVCGCTDNDPCAGGCSWAKGSDLCSSCAEIMADFLQLVVGHMGGQHSTGERIFRGLSEELGRLADRVKVPGIEMAGGLCIDAELIARIAAELEVDR